MKKPLALLLAGAFAVAALPAAHAQTGLPEGLSLRTALGPAFVIDAPGEGTDTRVGPGLEAALLYRSAQMPDWGLVAAYDRADFGRELDAHTLTAGLQLARRMRDNWVSFAEAAAGLGLVGGSQSMDNFALRLGAGLERMMGERLSIGAILNYYWINSDEEELKGDLHGIVPKAFVSYHFGR